MAAARLSPRITAIPVSSTGAWEHGQPALLLDAVPVYALNGEGRPMWASAGTYVDIGGTQGHLEQIRSCLIAARRSEKCFI